MYIELLDKYIVKLIEKMVGILAVSLKMEITGLQKLKSMDTNLLNLQDKSFVN